MAISSDAMPSCSICRIVSWGTSISENSFYRLLIRVAIHDRRPPLLLKNGKIADRAHHRKGCGQDHRWARASETVSGVEVSIETPVREVLQKPAAMTVV